MPDPLEREVLAWRARRRARLTEPYGWLSVVALVWLPEGVSTLGSDPSNDVVVPGLPPRVGSILVADDRAEARLEADAGVTRDGRPVRRLVLEDDRDGRPTVLEAGPVRFHLIRRDGDFALRVRDPRSPARRTLGPLEYFPIDARWRVEARFEPYDPPRTMDVPTVSDRRQAYGVPGTLTFEAGGSSHRIEAFREAGEEDLFVVFGDRTNGTETYGGGRYLYADPPRAGSRVVLDFNRAYNPPCVFTPLVTCALPLPGNRLEVRVEAGEKAYRGPGRHPGADTALQPG